MIMFLKVCEKIFLVESNPWCSPFIPSTIMSLKNLNIYVLLSQRIFKSRASKSKTRKVGGRKQKRRQIRWNEHCCMLRTNLQRKYSDKIRAVISHTPNRSWEENESLWLRGCKVIRSFYVLMNKRSGNSALAFW